MVSIMAPRSLSLNVLLGTLVEQLEQLVSIDEVEIARHSEVAGRVDVGLNERVAEFHIVLTLRAVTEMSQHYLAYEAEVALHEPGILEYFRVHLFELRHFLVDILEDLGDGLRPPTRRRCMNWCPGSIFSLTVAIPRRPGRGCAAFP
jgi:hypothetical protein